MRSVLAGLMLMVAGVACGQVQTPQQEADIARKAMLFTKGHSLHRKNLITYLAAPATGPVDLNQAYSAGQNGDPAKMALGNQQKGAGDNESAAGDGFYSGGQGLETQGDTAYSTGNYVAARTFYRSATGAYNDAQLHLEKAVGGYQGAIQWYQLSLRP